MLLDILKDFSWENEAEEIAFKEKGMDVIAHKSSDFWLDKSKNIIKNNAHFFYTEKIGDFEAIACFEAKDFANFAQAGIMVKANANNAFKISLMSKDVNNPKIGSSLTINGFSDWAIFNIDNLKNDIYYKITKKDNKFFAYVCVDGFNYILVRQFCFIEPLINVKVGSYFASPSENDYHATLKAIEIK